MPELLDLIDIEGTIVTADAMSCQKKIVSKIIEKRADYTIAVKENQPTLLHDIADWFEAFEKEAISIYIYINISSTCISIKCF